MTIQELDEKIKSQPSKARDILTDFIDNDVTALTPEVKEYLLKHSDILRSIHKDLKDEESTRFDNLKKEGKFQMCMCQTSFKSKYGHQYRQNETYYCIRREPLLLPNEVTKDIKENYREEFARYMLEPTIDIWFIKDDGHKKSNAVLEDDFTKHFELQN